MEPAPEISYVECGSRLPGLVRSYWEVHGDFPHVRERVLPTADIVFLVSLGAPHRLVSGTERRAFADSWVSGLQTAHLLTESTGRTGIWGARLSPKAAHVAFGSGAALAGQVVALGDLIGPAGVELGDRLRAAPTFADRCRLFDRFLGRASEAPSRDWPDAIDGALALLHGPARIDEIARELGWSRKHLYTRFVDYLGLAPKALGRIVRFESAVKLIGPHQRPNLAEVAIAAGYYDQAQFTREFHALAGETPSAYLRHRVPGSDHGFAEA